MRSFTVASFLISAAIGCRTVAAKNPHVFVDGAHIIGQLKNLQGTNNGYVPISSNVFDVINDTSPSIQQHWRDSGVKHVMIYTFPDVYIGGPGSDPYQIENYNFSLADERVRFVLDGGAKVSTQFQEGQNLTHANFTEETMQAIGFMLTDRYMNGAHNSGFEDAIELWDFYPEPDNAYYPTMQEDYERDLRFYTAFANGVAAANSTAGCGAWGYQRMWTPSADYTRPDPWKTSFFQEVVAHDIPIKAATFHWDNAQFSWDPYEVVKATKQFRELYLTPVGLSHLPIWISEQNRNPLGLKPLTDKTATFYNDPASFASWNIAVAIYGQDADAEQIMPWTGVGYGGYGFGPVWFDAWYNQTEDGDIALNAGAAWVLSGKLVTETPRRLAVDGSSSNGFSALAGASVDNAVIQILLNNYQVDYDLLREFAQEILPIISELGMASPLIQSNGLLNGEQLAILADAATSAEGVLTFPQATIRDNNATGYDLTVDNLPWPSYRAIIRRVSGEQVDQVYYNATGTGSSFVLSLDFPANAQDLVTITRSC